MTCSSSLPWKTALCHHTLSNRSRPRATCGTPGDCRSCSAAASPPMTWASRCSMQHALVRAAGGRVERHPLAPALAQQLEGRHLSHAIDADGHVEDDDDGGIAAATDQPEGDRKST